MERRRGSIVKIPIYRGDDTIVHPRRSTPVRVVRRSNIVQVEKLTQFLEDDGMLVTHVRPDSRPESRSMCARMN